MPSATKADELIGFAKITRDMTEREQARQRLLESEARFRRLVEAVVDYAIFQLDPNGIISTWNSGAQRIKGYTADEIIGQHFSVFYTEEDREAGVPAKGAGDGGARGPVRSGGWRVRKDGSRFCALVVIDPIRNEHGELIGFAKVTRDITERVGGAAAPERGAGAACGLAENGGDRPAQRRYRARLQQPADDRARQSRNRPASRENSARAPTPISQRAIANAMRGAQRAAALTSRLLAFSRRQPLDPKPLDVNKFLRGRSRFPAALAGRDHRS